MATNPAGEVSAYGSISNAPGRRNALQLINSISSVEIGEGGEGITYESTVGEIEEAITTIAKADREVTSNSIGRATSVEAD
jgi:hypothetical protein